VSVSDVNDLFVYPLKSSQVDVYRVCELTEAYSVFALSQLRSKCVRLPLDDSVGLYAIIPPYS